MDKHEREPGEESPLGLILCESAGGEQVELLQLGASGIRVATYLTKLPSKTVLEQKLRVAEGLMPIELRDITLDDFAQASEAFLTGTTRGVLPITQVDDRAIGDGQVGPHTKRLIQAFGREVDDYLSNVGI